MGEDLRAEIEAVCRESDRLNAEFERDEWQRAQRAKQSAPAGVDFEEWQRSRPRPPKPKPQVTTMAPEVQKLWDAWFDARVQKWVGHKSRLFNAIAEAFSLFREEERKHMHEHVVAEIKKQLDAEATKLRDEFAAEIGSLRADQAINRAVMKGEVTQLKSKSDAA